MLFWFRFVFNSSCSNIMIYCFRLGIYRTRGHEATVTITTVGLEVVLIGMLDLDELELPPSTLVVYTLLFGFRILGWITSLNPYSHEYFFLVQSREVSREKQRTRERVRSRRMEVLFLLRLEYRATSRYHTGFPFSAHFIFLV